MDVKRILLATDLSVASAAAEALAVRLADSYGAELLVVYVTPGQATNHLGPQYGGLSDPAIPEVARKLAAIKPARENACEHRILVGDPAAEVLRLTTEENIDLVVLGTHARSVTKRLMLGNVAERVLTRATPEVLVCKGSSKARDRW
jgi:nucleotide-binding universal stress UspA family protein